MGRRQTRSAGTLPLLTADVILQGHMYKNNSSLPVSCLGPNSVRLAIARAAKYEIVQFLGLRAATAEHGLLLQIYT